MSFWVAFLLLLTTMIAILFVYFLVEACKKSESQQEEWDNRTVAEASPEQVRLMVENYYTKRGLNMDEYEVIFLHSRLGFYGVRILKRHAK